MKRNFAAKKQYTVPILPMLMMENRAAEANESQTDRVKCITSDSHPTRVLFRIRTVRRNPLL